MVISFCWFCSSYFNNLNLRYLLIYIMRFHIVFHTLGTTSGVFMKGKAINDYISVRQWPSLWKYTKIKAMRDIEIWDAVTQISCWAFSSSSWAVAIRVVCGLSSRAYFLMYFSPTLISFLNLSLTPLPLNLTPLSILILQH